MSLQRQLVGKGFLQLGILAGLLLLLLVGCQAEPVPEPTLAPTAATLLPPTPTALALPTLIPTEAPPPTATPEPGPTATLAPPPTPTPIAHTVLDGETLSYLAVRYGVSVPEISAANGLAGDVIYVGQVLTIPNQTVGSDPAGVQTSDLPTYVVEEGDSFASVATEYGIPPETLQAANPQISDPNTVQVGTVLYLPLGAGEFHYVVAGDTLGGIAVQYDVSLDDLARENAKELDLNNLNLIYPGTILKIPQSGEVAAGYDCSPQPPRAGVIEYTVQNGERLLCLSQKFGISMATLLWANENRIVGEGAFQDGVTLLIPPTDGALYTISEDDLASDTKLEDLMAWYDVTQFADVQDQDGNPVTGPLSEVGQLLFLRNANPLAGRYEPPIIVSVPTPEPPPVASGDGGSLVPGDPGTVYIPPAVTPLDGGLTPKTVPWRTNYELDTGFCDLTDGAGWSGSLSWPVGSREVNDGRGFGPNHRGIDINVAVGTPVYAMESGVVVWAGFNVYGFGNLVVLAHGNTYQTYYGHLSEVFVGCGQTVSRGGLVGTSGQTGLSTWPALHIEVRYGGLAYDPMRWLP